MTYKTTSARMHGMVRTLRAAHRRGSGEWTRRMEVTADRAPGARL